MRESTFSLLVALTPSNHLFFKKNNYEMKHRAKLSSYPVSNLITYYLLPSLGQGSDGMLSNAAAEAELTMAVGSYMVPVSELWTGTTQQKRPVFWGQPCDKSFM